MPSECPLPMICSNETPAKYADRCMNYAKVAAKYPNRKQRRKVLIEFANSIPKFKRNYQTPIDKYLYHEDAARYIGINPRTLEKWVIRGWVEPGRRKTLNGEKCKYRYVYDIETLDKIKKVYHEAKREKQESDSD